MLPKTRLGDAVYRKLKVYAGPAHPHASQRPVARAAAPRQPFTVAASS